MLTADLLNKIAPFCKDPLTWAPALNVAMQEFEITKRNRICAFLAQILHESMSLNQVTENLSYSGTRLMQVWPSRFPTYESTKPYQHNPPALANFVYGDRGDLGNRGRETGDGWRYRGRCPIHLTGLANYVKAQNALNIPLVENPDLACSPILGSRIAAWWWYDKGLNTIADRGDIDSFFLITHIINGALTGKKSRLEFWHRAQEHIKG